RRAGRAVHAGGESDGHRPHLLRPDGQPWRLHSDPGCGHSYADNEPRLLRKGRYRDSRSSTAGPIPMIDPTVFIAPHAVVLGDVQIGRDSSVWYHTVIRGDTERIRIGEGSNLQDFTMVHADPGIPCLVGSRVTVGHRAILHGCVVEDDCLIGMG